ARSRAAERAASRFASALRTLVPSGRVTRTGGGGWAPPRGAPKGAPEAERVGPLPGGFAPAAPPPGPPAPGKAPSPRGPAPALGHRARVQLLSLHRLHGVTPERDHGADESGVRCHGSAPR